jgi:hypothetical protein
MWYYNNVRKSKSQYKNKKIKKKVLTKRLKRFIINLTKGNER